MKTGLETLLKGAKSTGNKLNKLVSTVSTLASNAINYTTNKAKSSLSAAALGASLLLSPSASQDANAEVLFTMESSNSIDYPKRFWMPKQILKLIVYAEDLSPEEKVSGIEWAVKSPEPFEYLGFTGTNPYLIQNGTQTNDFFYPIPMDDTANYVGHPFGQTKWPAQKGARFTREDRARSSISPAGKFPVAKDEGMVAIYHFKLPPDCPLGDYPFEIMDTRVYDPEGKIRESRGTKMTVRVMEDARSLYSNPTNKPLLLKDYNNNIPFIHVSQNWHQLQLETSSDLKNWQVLKVNDSQNPPEVKPYWNPFKIGRAH